MMQASGCIFLSLDTGRVMLQKRSGSVTHPGTWGFFGGKSEDNERPIETLLREIEEELGMLPDIQRVVPVNKFTAPNGKFEYNSFVITVTQEFTPILNSESDGFCWIQIGKWPSPLHSGAKIQCKSKQFVKKLKTILEQSSTQDGYKFSKNE
jgi:8-oxo-dGTP pyrophosphatase MutT (NUDIX family)